MNDVIDVITVKEEGQGLQVTKINLKGESTTEQFTEPGTYKLVRVDNE